MPRLVPPVIVDGALQGMEQPVIEAEDGLVLRRFEESDSPTVLAAFADSEIQRWHSRSLDDIEEAQAWISATHADWLAENTATWAIRSVEDVVLGRIALYPRLAAGSGEVTYWVLPAARGRGVAAGAVRALSRWAHGELGLPRLELKHSTRNERSCRVALKAGFLPEGLLRSSLLHADGWHDMHIHGRLATDRNTGGSPVPGWTT